MYDASCRVDEWVTNRRVVTKGDASVCEICLRWVKRCEHAPAATRIQTVFRGRRARRMVELKKTESIRAVVVIQRIARGNVTRNRVEGLRAERAAAATILQKWVRGKMARRYVARKAEIDFNSASRIKGVLFGMLVRKVAALRHARRLKGCMLIQRVVRGNSSRTQTRALAASRTAAAVTIQRLWRGKESRAQSASQHEAWSLIKSSIMLHLPHNTQQAALALQKLPVSMKAKMDILHRLPVNNKIQQEIAELVEGVSKQAVSANPLTSIVHGAKASSGFVLKPAPAHLKREYLQPKDVRTRFNSYRKFGAAPAAE
eukprot:TRINITY_DN11309_c0_g1_i4.p1 TRINITY_DN11309_c0_g1~~TRINITY_DN11309_c0_g1_i4.p1  ORF type:complete len:316 (-),score=80.39 TRINITY_DN11309_c0_g1_i4:295-1242(-)